MEYTNFFSSNGHLDVETGDTLCAYKAQGQQYTPRDIFSSLRKYIRHPANGKVCILYGLRRTGKTILLYQLLNQLNLATTLYVRLKRSDTMSDLFLTLTSLCTTSKVETILIDEATYAEDFTTSCAFLADTFAAKGIHVVLAGTDSLGFYFAKLSQLYDRCILLHTTFIPYSEWSSLLKIKSLDKYIRYGGTLMSEGVIPFKNAASMQEYLNTAIIENIQNSLKILDRTSIYSNLRELYYRYGVTDLINRVLEDHNHEFVGYVANRSFISHDLSSAQDIITQHGLSASLLSFLQLNRNAIINTLKELFSISDHTAYATSDVMITEMNGYLKDLDLIDTFNILHVSGTTQERTIFTQPGLRYAQAQLLMQAFTKQSVFHTLGFDDIRLLQKIISDDIAGRLLEEIVIYNTAVSLAAAKYPEDLEAERFIVFQYAFESGEFDMVVMDCVQRISYLFEIKHTSRIDFERQARHLCNVNAVNTFVKKYYPVKKRVVLYNGDPDHIKGISYVNTSDYLCGISQFFNR